MGSYFTINSSIFTTRTVSEADNIPPIGLGPRSTHSKKRNASGDLPMKASKTPILPSKEQQVNNRLVTNHRLSKSKLQRQVA
jgi:hypothetical protein